MIELVISKYNEDIHWVKNLPDHYSPVIYNKSGKNIDIDGVKVYDLPNIGRESQTFLFYMLFHYVPHKYDYIVFSQADPFDHSPDFMNLLGLSQHWKEIQPLSWQYLEKENLPPRVLLEDNKSDYIFNNRIRPELYSLHTWAPISNIDTGAIQIGIDYLVANNLNVGLNIGAHFLQQCGLMDLAERAYNAKIGRFSYGAIFAVSDEVLNNFVTKYKNCLSNMILLTAKHRINGYMFERMWLHMFGSEFINF